MYIFITYHALSDACDIELYETLGEAMEQVDERTEAQTKISGGVVIENYGDKYSVPVPMEFSMHFWPVGKIIYGTCVETDARGKVPGITEPESLFEPEKAHTYRMIAEKPVYNKQK